MAFDFPIESDRPGELGLLSSLMRAPLVGTLMWIISGDEKLSESSKDENINDPTRNIQDDDMGSVDSDSKEIEDNYNNRRASSKILQIDEDIDKEGDDGECSFSADNWANKLPHQLHNISENMLHDNYTFPPPQQKVKSKRKTSWSDESGQSLVEYLDATSIHEPKPDIPIKSAIRRSGSIYSNVPQDFATLSNVKPIIPSTNNVHSQIQNKKKPQYVPAGIASGGNGGGIVMPGSGKEKGHYSPQWGWYVTTTPPTPDRYPRTATPSKTIESSESVVAATAGGSSTNAHHAPLPVPVFNKSLKGSPRAHLEWTGIPL